MNEWKIQSRSNVCQACGKPFEDKQVYHTFLYEQKNELLRLDVCENCWRSQYSQGAVDKKGFVSYWQGTYETPPPAPPEPIKKETAETLLRKLIELNDSKYSAPAFILAVMLERKRILKVKQELNNDGKRIFVYEHSKTGEVFSVIDPQIDSNRIVEVQHTVSELLEHGIPEEKKSNHSENLANPEALNNASETSVSDSQTAILTKDTNKL
ncbi:MAG: hypothetical protein ACP5MG_02720 [Verrucomicrobiia bacterium]